MERESIAAFGRWALEQIRFWFNSSSTSGERSDDFAYVLRHCPSFPSPFTTPDGRARARDNRLLEEKLSRAFFVILMRKILLPRHFCNSVLREIRIARVLRPRHFPHHRQDPPFARRILSGRHCLSGSRERGEYRHGYDFIVPDSALDATNPRDQRRRLLNTRTRWPESGLRPELVTQHYVIIH